MIETIYNNAYVACRTSHVIELPRQTPSVVFYIFFVSLLSAAQHLAPANVCV